MNEDDGLPNIICLSCANNLESLTRFRRVSLRINEMSKLKLGERLNIKTEEVLLEDLTWENAPRVDSPANVYNSSANDKVNEWKLSDSKQNTHVIENINSPVK